MPLSAALNLVQMKMKVKVKVTEDVVWRLPPPGATLQVNLWL
jgi:hypothetical protein